MTYLTKFVAFATLPVLAACGGGSSGSGGSGDLFATTDDGSFEEVVTSSGVTGYVGWSDGTISQVRVRADLSGEEAIVYLSIDGGEEVAYALDEGNEFGDYPVYLVGPENAGLFFGDNGSDMTDFISFGSEDRTSLFDGTIGLRTADLPDETIVYEGDDWAVYSQEIAPETLSIAGDTMTLTVGFGTGTVTGAADGDVGYYDTVLEAGEVGNITATIAGSIEGSELNATMTVVGDATATLEMQGAVYGVFAEELSGAMGGSINYEGLELDAGGWFLTERALSICIEC